MTSVADCLPVVSLDARTANDAKPVTPVEPFLQPRNSVGGRFVTLFRNPDLAALVEQARALFWSPREVEREIAGDATGFASLPDGAKTAMRLPMAWFLRADGVVGENIVLHFMRETSEVPECVSFYTWQAAIEQIHAETYAKQVITCFSPREQTDLFEAFDRVPSVATKAAWAQRYTNPETRSFAARLAAFAIVESVFFQTSFGIIYWVKHFHGSKMKGLVVSNDLIARDEAAHVEFAAALFRRMVNRPSPADFAEMLRDAVDAECAFVRDALPEPLPGLNADDMCEYVRCCADDTAAALGYDRPYGAACPFPWMLTLALRSRKNGFEVTQVEYQRPESGGDDVTANANDATNAHVTKKIRCDCEGGDGDDANDDKKDLADVDF